MAKGAGIPSEAPGKAFEARVADAYRALGYQVTPNVQLPGKQTDLIARREVEGAPRMVLALECRDAADPIGNVDVLAFVSRVVAHREAREITAGVLVSANGFTADARAAGAGHPYVSLLSWEELASDILDVRHQMRDLVGSYERSEIYQDYLPLQLDVAEWQTTRTAPLSPHVMEDVLEAWIGPNSATHSLFVLADFGAGKTTLLRYLEYDRAKAYLAREDTRVPLFVPLRDFRESQDLTALLRASFRDTYYRDLPRDLLWRRVQDGLFYLLLDGFDEMVERSDAARRLELFHALMVLLRSASPTLVTSRPSYFVEREELDELLAMLRKREATIAAPALGSQGGEGAAADRLRKKLVRRHRESRPGANDNDRLPSRGVRVGRLLPLDQKRVEAFLERRAPKLHEANASPKAVMDFIDRTYDLSDLSSRPLLLTLIVDSVILGELNVHDTAAQYGASGLYEIYTHAKLDLDFAKGRSRQLGLPLETRRLLAEALAVQMYRATVLERDFHQLFVELMREPGQAGEALKTSGLSEDEIATDFATCSFVTLDQNGRCRFVHKSFRGFFVARVLKDHLKRPHPMLSEWLEREVLYFLGGFAPTQPEVGERLWALFLHADHGNKALRRNALVAFLYTRPDHDSRRVTDAEVAEAEFGRLAFSGSRMRDVRWRECSVNRLELGDVRWRDVGIASSHVGELVVHDGSIDLDLADSTVEALEVDRGVARLGLMTATLHRCSVVAADVLLHGREISVGAMSVAGSRLTCETGEHDEAFVEQIELRETRARFSGNWTLGVRGERSAIVWGGRQTGLVEWELDECVVALDAGPDDPRRARFGFVRGEVGGALDSRSVVLARGDVAHELLAGLPCGIFGAVKGASGRSRLPAHTRAWGVLEADELVRAQPHLPRDAGACLHGRLLLATSDWFARQVSPDGQLSAVLELERFVSRDAASCEGEELVRLLSAVAEQHRAVTSRPWDQFA